MFAIYCLPERVVPMSVTTNIYGNNTYKSVKKLTLCASSLATVLENARWLTKHMVSIALSCKYPNIVSFSTKSRMSVNVSVSIAYKLSPILCELTILIYARSIVAVENK